MQHVQALISPEDPSYTEGPHPFLSAVVLRVLDTITWERAILEGQGGLTDKLAAILAALKAHVEKCALQGHVHARIAPLHLRTLMCLGFAQESCFSVCLHTTAERSLYECLYAVQHASILRPVVTAECESTGSGRRQCCRRSWQSMWSRAMQACAGSARP